MLFYMGSARHLDTIHNGSNDLIYWILALAVMAAAELNALVGVSAGRQKYLTTVSGTIHAGLGLTVVLYLLSLINS
jgi:hypothetical protein